MPAPFLLGIDLGTTTCRAALFDRRGEEVAWAAAELAVRYPRPRWAEVDPDAWWQGTVRVVRRVLAAAGAGGTSPNQIAAVGLTGLMHAPVLLDAAGQPVAPAMLWMDQRCAPQCEAMQREAEAAGIAAAWRAATSQSAPKLRWLAEERPDVLARASRFLLPKDFIRFRLTGASGTDPADAGGTGLFDREAGDWSAPVVELSRVPRRLLPPIRPAESLAGRVTPDAAAQTGLCAGTPVAVGGGDTFCTRLGAGTLAPGEVCIYLGTAAWIAMARAGAADGRTRVRGFGATSTTGAALRWARDLLREDEGQTTKDGEWSADVAAAVEDGPRDSAFVRSLPLSAAKGPSYRGSGESGGPPSYDGLTAAAAAVPPGAEGLCFLPHLMGERGPEAEPLAQGALVGLTLRHGRAHVVRAVLEGTAIQIRRLLESAAGLGGDDPPIAGLVCGGGARSTLWTQILCDVTGLPLRAPAMVEAGVLGAAMLAGAIASGEPVAVVQKRMVRPGATYRPRPGAAVEYAPVYRRYCQLDTLLMPWFREVSV